MSLDNHAKPRLKMEKKKIKFYDLAGTLYRAQFIKLLYASRLV